MSIVLCLSKPTVLNDICLLWENVIHLTEIYAIYVFLKSSVYKQSSNRAHRYNERHMLMLKVYNILFIRYTHAIILAAHVEIRSHRDVRTSGLFAFTIMRVILHHSSGDEHEVI